MNIDKIKKWQKMLDGQINEMTDILERKFILEETRKMIESNSAINQDNLFYDHFRINYVYAQIIQLSRMLDQDSRTESLVNLLTDIEENPEIFDRNWRDEILKLVSDPSTVETFGHALEEKSLTADAIAEDKCQLLCKFSPIKKYRDRQIAHKQSRGQRPNLSFQKLDEFIEHLHKRVLVYAHFLNGSGYPDSGLMPIIQYDWQAIFRVPWINDLLSKK